MSAALSRFTFQGDDLEVVTEDGSVFVGVRAICDSLGVSYQGQIEKLKSDPSQGVKMILTPSAGGPQETAFVPLRTLPLWLATIHPGKVKAAVREKVIAYRCEAAEVLADHFLGPRVAPLPPPPARGRPLTAKQAAIFEYLMAYRRTFDTTPTHREIGAHFGWSSTNAVHDHLVCMEKKGAIRLRSDGRSRGIILPPEPRPAPAAPPPVPPAAVSEIAELRGMVGQLIAAVASLASARPPRRRLLQPSMSLPFAHA